MKTKLLFVKQLIRQRKIEFYMRAYKILLLIIIVILSLFMIIDKIKERDFSTVILLLISVVLFSSIAYLFYKSAMDFYSIHKSRIYYCIEHPEHVTEIIVTSQKILFEIKGMEDETLFIKDSERKTEILNSIKNIFGEDKIVINN
jgi:hypothetical protein